MAKTKTVKAWGVFDKEGQLTNLGDDSYRPIYMICTTEKDADWSRQGGETVRPVTISWEVEE